MKKSVLFFGMLLVIGGVMFPSCQDISSVDYTPEKTDISSTGSYYEAKKTQEDGIIITNNLSCLDWDLISLSDQYQLGEYCDAGIVFLCPDDVIVLKTNDSIEVLFKSDILELYNGNLYLDGIYSINDVNSFSKKVFNIKGHNYTAGNDKYLSIEFPECNKYTKEILIVFHGYSSSYPTFHPIKILL